MSSILVTFIFHNSNEKEKKFKLNFFNGNVKEMIEFALTKLEPKDEYECVSAEILDQEFQQWIEVDKHEQAHHRLYHLTVVKKEPNAATNPNLSLNCSFHQEDLNKEMETNIAAFSNSGIKNEQSISEVSSGLAILNLQSNDSKNVDASNKQLPLITSFGKETVVMNENHKLKRVVIGNKVFLGNFYDAKTDSLDKQTELSIDSGLINTNKDFNVGDYTVCTDSELFFDELSLYVDQKLSMLSLLTSKTHLTNFILNVSSLLERQFILVQIIRTKVVELDLSNKNVLKKVFRPFGDNTHIIDTIIYGNVLAGIFTCNDEKIDFKLLCKTIHKKLQNNIVLDYQSGDLMDLRSLNISVEMFTHTFYKLDKELSFDEALEMFKTFSIQMDQKSDYPLWIGLTPISSIFDHDILDSKNFAPKTLDYNISQRIFTMIASFDYAAKMIKIYYIKCCKYSYCLSEKCFTDINERIKQFKAKGNEVIEKTKNLIFESRIHDQNSEVDKLHSEVKKYINNVSSYLDDINAYFTKMEQFTEPKISEANFFIAYNVSYIGRGTKSLEEELVRVEKETVYVLFYDKEKDNFNVDNAKFFYQILEKKQKKCIFFNLNLALKPINVPDGTRVVKYKNGIIVQEDCLLKEFNNQNVCCAKSNEEKQAISAFPVNSIPLETPCPESVSFGGKCAKDDCCWECAECNDLIHFDLNSVSNGNGAIFFYCKCGKAKASSFVFRCKDLKHQKYSMYSWEKLYSMLVEIASFGVKNILILGESGVGKSTWINALANYLTFPSFNEAIEAENPICLIPSQFTVTDVNDKRHNVQVGKAEKEESTTVGESATLAPKAHVFNYKGGKVRLIDTSGLCDTAGVSQDAENFKSTLNYIRHYTEIHAICILLKPNVSRMSEAFKYCMGELFTHLHKSAANNICFCFTNTQGTFYKPGETYPLLEKYLQTELSKKDVIINLTPDNVYSFDNESFRYLFAIKNHIEFDKNIYQINQGSWNASVKETMRLLQNVREIQPHKSMETISLNNARMTIIALAQPLAKITDNIQTNISLIKDKQNEISKLDVNSKDFLSKLTYEQKYLVAIELNHPRTVCTAEKCVQIKRDDSGRDNVYYVQHCHPHCYLRDVPLNIFPEPQIQNCAAMLHGVCRVCGCPWNVHMHISYDQEEKTRMVEDPQYSAMLKDNTSRITIVNRFIADTQTKIQALKNEQKTINNIAARFGSFLKHHSIMPFNDSIKAYVELAIRDAQRVAQKTKDTKKLDGLNACLKEYEEQKRIMQNYLDCGKEEIKPEDIEKYYRLLITLPHTGKDMKKLFDFGNSSIQKQVEHNENQFNNKRQRSNKSQVYMNSFQSTQSSTNPMGSSETQENPHNTSIFSAIGKGITMMFKN